MAVIYQKNNSFTKLNIKNNENLKYESINDEIKNFITEELKTNNNEILNKILSEIKNKETSDNSKFNLTKNVIAEYQCLNDENKINYLINRYKYEVYPKEKILNEYPPLVQIEPTSMCNYRCIFCYQTDDVFNKKKSGHMGHMKFDLYKKIIDEIENNVQFVTLASRGEPLMSPDFAKMMDYSKDKFINFKINTNASMLNESKIHSILKNNISTLVFSADAADGESYKKYRVNGNLEKVLNNIRLFNTIKNKDYPESRIITRVSGVKYSEEQDLNEMQDFWGELVDQVAFVNYLPWENVYNTDKNEILTPCSDLWRRMFVWWDGKANPCDVDYKSELSVGNANEYTVKELWNSENYNNLRLMHLNKLRNKQSPCNKCSLI
ncbi:MAG: radical SAM protein [Pelagibacteraceae bacterium]|mgnify:CR=1 FL=1|nr:radical SAM protein [Pelagibacteraceae bacterium]|tara:strand:+ start:34045 stop:35184 length:1140 start_codon:yes stop_codon:yes gene_type:complete